MEKYEAIEMEVIAFDAENVIVTSPEVPADDSSNTPEINIPL